ncbi:MAG: hypothetical protein EWM73_02291 [Nitrospira sp.]|nr:MAG: hypothetical protein EWM73_02291 [Nitrospira sp.]
MIVVIVEADLAIGDHLFVLCEPTDIVVPAIEDMLHFMWMDADGGIDERVLLRQCDRCLAGRQIAADGDEGFDAGFPSAGNHRLAILIVAGIVQMGMCVDQHAAAS